jgi:acetolactate synthase I/II/III large subunit
VEIEALDSELPVGEAIVWALADAGVKYVLTLPGGYIGPILIALHGRPEIRVLQVREESIGTAMAEAYGRLTGTPIVVLGQGQWISGNAGQGLLEAHLGSSPVVVLTEMTDGGSFSHHGPFQSGDGEYGSWDARTALSGVTKRVMTSRFPVQAVQHTQLALKHAISGEPGPIAVIFHSEALKGTVGPGSRPRIYSSKPYLSRPTRGADPDSVTAAVGAIKSAQRPVIVAGNGVRVSQATQMLAGLASVLDAPVVTTAAGKGVFVETDPRSGGPMGTYGLASANLLISEADLLLAVGTKLGPSDTLRGNPGLIDPQRQTLVQIDAEPLNLCWTFPVQHGLAGDAACVMGQVIEAWSADPPAPRTTGAAERVREALGRFDSFADPAFDSDDTPLRPQRIIRLLEEAGPDHAIITCDAGENRLFMMHWFRNTCRGGYLQPAGSGGMGYAVRAAMGAKLACPDRPVIAVCGDGAFSMNLHSMMTAVQEGLPIAVVVFNNASLGWVLHAMGDKAVAGEFADVDFAAIARTVGCEGIRVTSAAQLRDAFKAALAPRTVPLVIDVPTSMATSFREAESRNLFTVK